MADYNFLLETRLSQDQQAALGRVEQVCRGAGLNLYLTGGAMRDLLSGNRVRSLEITTEGDPAKLAARLRAAGAERMSPQSSPSGLRFRLQGCRVRIQAAQAEGRRATIVEDLRGRGLTLNSIGLSLNPGSRGLPLDPTNGAADIEARLIRMNHPYVFLEEPMTMVRAQRLRIRMGFELEERTAGRMELAREAGYLERATVAARGRELEAIAYEPDAGLVVSELDKGQWLEAGLGKGVRASRTNPGGLARLGAAVETWEQLGLSVDQGMVALALLLGKLGRSDQQRLTRALPSRHLAEWKRLALLARNFEKKVRSAGPAGWGKLQEMVERTAPEVVVLAWLEPKDARAAKKLKEYQAVAQRTRERMPVGVLRAAGLAPRSQAAEALWRPLFRRLLAGETISDGQLMEEVRAAVAAQLPAGGGGGKAKPAAAGTASARGGAGKARGAKTAAKAVVTPAPRAKPGAKATAKPARGAKPAAKVGAKTISRARPAAKAAAKPPASRASKPARGAKRAAKTVAKPARNPGKSAARGNRRKSVTTAPRAKAAAGKQRGRG